MRTNKERTINKLNNKVYKNVGLSLLTLRKFRNKNQREFAKELKDFLLKEFNIKSNYDYKTISNWESGKSIPKFDILIAISQHYNLSLDELLKAGVDEIISKSSFSSFENDLLQEFIDNEHVCVKKNEKYVSAFNPELYMYGQLSYLADNLVEYRGELSKNFSFTNATKDVQIIVGIMDVNDGKRELHYLGNGENDIVSVENIPSNYCEVDIENNNVIKSIMYNEITNNNFKQVIKLGNGKCYYIDEGYSNYDIDEYKFIEGNIPNDLDFYELNKKDDDWTDYACLKGHYIIDDKLFDFESSGTWYYKKAGIFEVVLFGKIKCTDTQLVKVLSDDYKHRLVKVLDKVSDDAICEEYKKQVDRYENKKGGKL